MAAIQYRTALSSLLCEKALLTETWANKKCAHHYQFFPYQRHRINILRDEVKYATNVSILNGITIPSTMSTLGGVDAATSALGAADTDEDAAAVAEAKEAEATVAEKAEGDNLVLLAAPE